MTSSVTIECETASGQSLEGLANVITERSRILGETTKDAVIASAIDVLKSLRSRTLDAKASKNETPNVAARDDLYPSFTRGPLRCLRSEGGARYTPNSSVRWLRNSLPDRFLHVFEVTPVHKTRSPYFIVAPDSATAIAYEQRAAKHRIDTFGTLARHALGVAMAQLSTYNVSEDGVSTLAAAAGSRLATVQKSGSGFDSGEYSVSVSDDLNYSVDALANGASDLDSAIEAASNKIVGMLNHHLHQLGDLSHDVQSPFKDEVVK